MGDFEKFINDKEIEIKSNELNKLLNKWRLEEGKTEVRHNNFKAKIDKEIKTLKTLEDSNVLKSLDSGGVLKIKQSTYINSQNKEQPCYILNRDMILLVASKESTYVRMKLIEYINVLETYIEESGQSEEFKYYRQTGKIIRREMTDEIQRIYPKTKQYKFIYARYSNLVYNILFDKNAKELKLEKGLKKSERLRDNFTSEELEKILELENKIKSLLIVYDMEGVRLDYMFDRVENTIRRVYNKSIVLCG